MPELPEVETVCRGLRGLVQDHKLIEVVVRRRDLRIPIPIDFELRLTGRTVLRLERGEGRGRDGDPILWGGLMGIARILGVIAAIVAGVWLITWAGGRFAARRKVEQAGKEKMPDEMILSDQ